MQLSHATYLGECISAHHYDFHVHYKSDNTGLSPHQPAHLHPTPDLSMDYLQCLDVSLTQHLRIEGLIFHELSLNSSGCKDHNPCIPRILAVSDPSLTTNLNQISTSDMILDPMFPDKEPCPHHQHNNILGRRFGVLTQITATSWHTHCVTASELLRMYIITFSYTHFQSTLQYHAMDNLLGDIIPFRLPCTMVLQVQNQYVPNNAILDNITYSEGTECDSVQCYFLKKNSILNWSEAYQNDPNISSLLLHLRSNQNKWTTSDLATIYTGYRTALKELRIQSNRENGSPQIHFGSLPTTSPHNCSKATAM